MHSQPVGSRAVRCNWANQKVVANGDGSKTLDYNTVIRTATPTNTTVYVGNLTPDITRDQLAIPFGQYGKLEEVRVVSERGYAFIRYAEHESAARAIVGMDSERIGVRMIKCSWGRERPNSTPPTEHNPRYQMGYGNAYPSYPPPPPYYGGYGGY
jgi:nucleolysin TIA-1/TIAR